MVKTIKELNLKFNVPIVSRYEQVKSSPDDMEEPKRKMFITGTAINETITSNGHQFTAEELMNSAPSLCDKPLLKDHINSVDAVVGRTTMNCQYNVMNKCIDFEAFVMDDDMQEKIQNGLINAVSVGAVVESMEYVEEGQFYKLSGIHFKELSLVAVGADSGATFAKAIACAADLMNPQVPVTIVAEQKTQTVEPQSTITEVNMSEELTQKDAVIAELNKKIEQFEAAEKAVKAQELTALKEKYNAITKEKNVQAVDVSELGKDVVEALIAQLSTVQKKVEEAVKPEFKGEITMSKESIKDADNYIVAKSETGAGLGIFKNPFVAEKDSVFYRGN